MNNINFSKFNAEQPYTFAYKPTRFIESTKALILYTWNRIIEEFSQDRNISNAANNAFEDLIYSCALLCQNDSRRWSEIGSESTNKFAQKIFGITPKDKNNLIEEINKNSFLKIIKDVFQEIGKTVIKATSGLTDAVQKELILEAYKNKPS